HRIEIIKRSRGGREDSWPGPGGSRTDSVIETRLEVAGVVLGDTGDVLPTLNSTQESSKKLSSKGDCAPPRFSPGSHRIEAHPAGSLLSFLAAVPDPRSSRGRRHPLTALLGLVCCAIMCGAKSYAAIAQWGHDQDIALMHQLGFTRKPPKLGGIRKVLIALNPNAFEGALTRWVESVPGGATATPLTSLGARHPLY